jgi:hypothetical protein
MDALTFIEKLVGSAIWPLTTLTIVLILKRPIISILSRLRKFKSKEVELELGSDFESIGKAAKGALAAGGEDFADEQAKRYESLMKASPKTVVVENWKRIEKSISQRLLDIGVELGDEDFKRPMSLVEGLRDRGLADGDTLALIRSMLVLRNKVVHYEPLRIRPKDARLYYENAILILAKLRGPDGGPRF